MVSNLDEFKGEYFIHICKDGTVTTRHESEPVFNGAAIPFYKTETKEDAELLVTMTCSLSPFQAPDLPDGVRFVYTEFTGEIEDIIKVQEKFIEMHNVLTNT